MKERRSLFSIIFGRPKKEPTNQTQLQLMNGYIPTWSTYTGEPYDYEVVRSAVDAIARNAAKLQARHIRRIGDNVAHVRSDIERLLSSKPNPYMDAYSFVYKVVTQLYMRNNAFVYIHYDDVTKEPVGFYPVLASTVELVEGLDKVIYAKFRFMSGERLTVPYLELVHLRRHYYKNDLFGEPSDKALTPTLELIRGTDEGIVNAVKSSASLRGILKFTAMLKPEDMKAQKEAFVRDYMSLNNDGGIAATDAKAEYVPLDNKPQMVDAKQMDAIKTKVYDFFGINEKIIRSTYNEDEWNAFYESIIEPIAVQMSLAFSSRLFTERELGHGNQIIFEANRLQYASMRTKMALVSMVDRGAMTPNEWRAVLNLGPIEGGDKPIRRLDTAEVDPDPTDPEEDEEGVDDDEQTIDDDDAESDEEGS